MSSDGAELRNRAPARAAEDAEDRLNEEFISLINHHSFQWRPRLEHWSQTLQNLFRNPQPPPQPPQPPQPPPQQPQQQRPPPPQQQPTNGGQPTWGDRADADEEQLNNGAHGQLYMVRQRLFRAIFTKIALLFVLTLPPRVRKSIEYSLLAGAVACLLVLTYLHVVFVRRPRSCLEGVQENWTTGGILRLEILDEAEQRLQLDARMSPEESEELLNTLADRLAAAVDSGEPQETGSTAGAHSQASIALGEPGEAKLADSNAPDGGGSSSLELLGRLGQAVLDFAGAANRSENRTAPNMTLSYVDSGQPKTVDEDVDPAKNTTEEQSQTEQYKEKLTRLQMLTKSVFSNGHSVVEYSLEHGFLRLSSKTRQKLNIPVKVIYLNPDEEKCFGDWFSRTLMKYCFGYNDILMNSLKYLAEKQNNRGYVRNVITGEYYRFVNIYMTRSSYVLAAVIMLVFTLTMSMLLRYSHHQVFIFVAQLTQMLEFNTPVSFPFAPLLTVILALIGMEAIMTDFFNDSTIAFYIILIVWSADQYDWFCCHTTITRRNWLKFFYLYHFSFYAYHYRFNGQYAGLALLTSWLFILHSMVYFFHHYELPHILSQSARITVTAHLHQSTLVSQLTMHGSLLRMRILRTVQPDLAGGADGLEAEVQLTRPAGAPPNEPPPPEARPTVQSN